MALLLFIDDDEARLRGLLEAVRGQRHRARTVQNGPKVVDVVTRTRPDLLIVGLESVGESHALVRRIREACPPERLPILLACATTPEADAVAVPGAGS